MGQKFEKKTRNNLLMPLLTKTFRKEEEIEGIFVSECTYLHIYSNSNSFFKVVAISILIFLVKWNFFNKHI